MPTQERKKDESEALSEAIQYRRLGFLHEKTSLITMLGKAVAGNLALWQWIALVTCEINLLAVQMYEDTNSCGNKRSGASFGACQIPQESFDTGGEG